MRTMDIHDILRLLPHKYPFLLVDRIIECDDKEHIVGIKNVTINEPHFHGHFPSFPVMPGVLQLEAMAQVGGILLSIVSNTFGKLPLNLGVDKARFRRMVVPGDTLRIQVDIISYRGTTARMKGAITVEGQRAAEAEMLFMLSNQEI